MQEITDGDVALSMTLELMRVLGETKALTGKQLDEVMRLGLDLSITDPTRRKRLRSYAKTWAAERPRPD